VDFLGEKRKALKETDSQDQEMAKKKMREQKLKKKLKLKREQGLDTGEAPRLESDSQEGDDGSAYSS